MWLDLFQGKSAPNLGFLGIEKQYLFRFNSALVRVVGYRCMGVCREKLHALLILPLLPWKRTWPSGSHPLLIILLLLQVLISAFSCSLSLPGRINISGCFTHADLGCFFFFLFSLKLKWDHGFPTFHISALCQVLPNWYLLRPLSWALHQYF